MMTYENMPLADDRFRFGENWSAFLATVDEERVSIATESLATLLGARDLSGRSFLDVGSGSGLSSLAAERLGAALVHSFDYDEQSVATTEEMRQRFAPNANWRVERGDALDPTYLERLGQFDVVYSWGVLHHTGDMWTALANLPNSVKPVGLLSVAIYNDQGRTSGYWHAAKKTYNSLPPFARPLMAAVYAGISEVRSFVGRTLRKETVNPIRAWRDYRGQRGMSRWHDYVDWIGGYPFEVATPEGIFDFYRVRGFALEKLKTCGGGLGCNEFTFRRQR